MRRLMIGCLLVCAVGCARRATRFRSNFRNCSAAAGGEIVCNGVQAAQVECFEPRSNACRALAIRYADGERVWLFQPMGFDPDNPEASAQSEDERVVIQPEMARDASLLWYRTTSSDQGYWTTYEPLSGTFGEVDTVKVLQYRDRQETIPLWNVK
ncbi:MAG TPA: hypothetical protein VGH20_16125 [Myxococcales bacterium]